MLPRHFFRSLTLAVVLAAACCAGVKWGVGRSFRHFRIAAWNCGERGSMPLPEPNWREPPAPGSGKLATPFTRMHLENLSAALRPPAPIATSTAPPAPPALAAEPLPAEPTEEEPELDAPAVPEAWCDLPSVATLGELPPPQPASAAAIASAASAASAVGRRRERAIGFVTFS